MAFVLPTAGQPLRESLAAHATEVPSCITYPKVEDGSTFEIRHHMLEILPSFHESIKLRLFPYTLKDGARKWLLTLPSGSITSWNQLSAVFLSKYYPASKTLDMRTQILTFAEKPNEAIHEARERYKVLLRKCPHSGINGDTQINLFYKWLNLTAKTLVNASCGGTYSDKNALQAYQLFENMATESQQWAVDVPQTKGVFEMFNGSPHVFAQLEKMEKKLENFDAKFDMLLQRMAAPVQQPTAAAYDKRGAENSVGTTRAATVQPQIDSKISTESVQPLDRSENIAVHAAETTEKSERIYVPPMPYPERLKPHAEDQQLTDFIKTLAKVQINLPLIDAIKNIPSYAKFLKDVCTKKKKLVDFEKVILTKQCSAVLLQKLPPKKKDPGSFTISCTIGNFDFKCALIDLDASINLMPFSVFQRLGQGEIKPTSDILLLADCSVSYPKGIIEDLIIKVDNLYLPANFVVLDMDKDMQTPIILGCPFMGTARTLIDVETRTLTLRVQEQSVVFNLFEATKKPSDMQDYMRVDVLEGIMHADIMRNLSSIKEDKLLRILRDFQDAIGWTIADFKGISPTLCMHRILMEEGAKPTIDAQRRLKPIMKEVVRNEVMKLLNAGMIYPISYSK
ncbi:unnamed protein product [Malus baccata var. baccata]